MKTSYQKPRICIALPGTDYVAHAPLLFANTLPMLPYLQEVFDVTILFRKVVGKPQLNYKYLTILDNNQLSESAKQQSTANFSPTGVFSAGKYLQKLNQFAQSHYQEFDLVLERQWSLVGALADAFARYQVSTIFVVEAEFYTTKKSQFNWKTHPISQLSNYLFKQLLPQVRRKWIKNSQAIIVETEQMKSFLIEQNYASKDKTIYSIPNGINPDIFSPRDRHNSRQQLGISQTEIILTYVGSLNRFIQEPGAIIEALGKVKPQNVVLYIIGDGLKRKELEKIAQKYQASVKFQGRLTQQESALYMGAANICIAPYNKALFPNKKFTSASLKVCEYLACGRPVLTIPCKRMNHLLDDGKYGFLVENNLDSYQAFFHDLPSLAEIQNKEITLINDLNNSTLKSNQIVMTWNDIADIYKKAITRTLKS